MVKSTKTTVESSQFLWFNRITLITPSLPEWNPRLYNMRLSQTAMLFTIIYLCSLIAVESRTPAGLQAYDSFCGAQALEPMASGCCAGDSDLTYMYVDISNI